MPHALCICTASGKTVSGRCPVTAGCQALHLDQPRRHRPLQLGTYVHCTTASAQVAASGTAVVGPRAQSSQSCRRTLPCATAPDGALRRLELPTLRRKRANLKTTAAMKSEFELMGMQSGVPSTILPGTTLSHAAANCGQHLKAVDACVRAVICQNGAADRALVKVAAGRPGARSAGRNTTSKCICSLSAADNTRHSGLWGPECTVLSGSRGQWGRCSGHVQRCDAHA